MASRVRQSTAAPTQRRAGNELPPYEKSTFPLNPAAQRTLAQLSHAHNLKKLDNELLAAQKRLSDSAADINDRLTAKTRVVAKRTHEQSSGEGENGANEELERTLEALRERVERMTQRMDESMRKMIDGRHNVQSINDSLAGALDHARANASTQASTQNVTSQRTRRRGEIDGEDDVDGDDSDEYQDFEPTDPAARSQSQTSTIEAFKSKLDDAKTRYQSHSLTARYADNNEYRDFRRVIHDAQHPDGDSTLPHHTEWFREQEPPPPGVSTRARNAATEDDDDDDIAVSRATISTRCPLTLQELKTPLTSRKCPHSFESEAILSMINTSSNRENGRPNGERFVQCPVTGCMQTLTRSDLHTDNVLVRKIKRIQRARELEDDDAEEETGSGRGGVGQTPTMIEDDAADVDDIIEGRVGTQAQVKGEPKGTASMRRTASTAPRGSGATADNNNGTPDIVSDEEDSEEEAEEEDMMEE